MRYFRWNLDWQLAITLLLTVTLGSSAHAQKCPDGQVLYLSTGNPPSSLTSVGCRLDGASSQCQSAPPRMRQVYSKSGNCHLCLDPDPVALYGEKIPPRELIERGALGFFQHPAKGVTQYSVDFDCLRESSWGCAGSISTPYSCKQCASLPNDVLAWSLAAWTFDDRFDESWFLASPISNNKLPKYSVGVREAATVFSEADQVLEFKDREVALDLIADGDFSVEGWIRTTSKETQVVASKRIGGGIQGSPEGGIFNPYPFVGNVGILFRDTQFRDFDCTCAAGGYCGLQVIISGGRLGIQMANGRHYNFLPSGPNVPATANIADGKWHHFAVTVDRSENDGITFYVDAMPVGHENPTRRKGCLSNDANLFIGGQSAGSAFGFIGELDELTFWATVLEIQDIRNIYEAENHGHCFIAWLPQ